MANNFEKDSSGRIKEARGYFIWKYCLTGKEILINHEDVWVLS